MYKRYIFYKGENKIIHLIPEWGNAFRHTWDRRALKVKKVIGMPHKN